VGLRNSVSLTRQIFATARRERPACLGVSCHLLRGGLCGPNKDFRVRRHPREFARRAHDRWLKIKAAHARIINK
jgi:hypothetical protein